MKHYICDKCSQVIRIKQYPCIECNQKYSTKSNLNRHIKSVHEVKKSNIVDEFNKSDIPISNANENSNDLIKSDAEMVEKKKINNLSSSEETSEQKEKINPPKCKKKYVKKCSDYNEIWENLI